MELANRCIESALLAMDKWITKGNWNNGIGAMFLSFRDAMHKYYLRLTRRVERQSQVHKSTAPMRTSDSALRVYLREPRRADKSIPPILQSLDKKVQDVDEYVMIDVNDYMSDLSRMQRHRYILQLQQGLSLPIFCYTWVWGCSRAGINPYVIWRVPLESKKEERDDGMIKSQQNIENLHKNTSLYHTRAERTSYLAAVVNKNFINSVTAAQAVYEFITGDQLSKNFVNPDASLAARFALSCQDPDIVIDLRKLNARPKSNVFDEFGGVVANVVEGRVQDRRHGELMLDALIFIV